MNAAKAAEKNAAKEAASAAKETERCAWDLQKMIGDVLKSKLKGKKKRVNGRRAYSVPGSTVCFECVSPSDFERLFSSLR